MKLRPFAEVRDPLPAVRMLIPFVIGILLAEQGSMPAWFPVTAAAVCGLLTWLFRSSAAAFLFLLFFGFGEAQYLRPEISIPLDTHTLYALRITGDPVERAKGSSADASIEAWRDPASGSWQAANDRVRIFTDSCVHPAIGDRIVCRGRVRGLFTNQEAENYHRQLSQRGIVGQLYIAHHQIYTHTNGSTRTLHAETVDRIRRLSLSPDAEALSRAMVAGDRSKLSPELRQRFSQSGLTHLLAVSGLHTGIIFVWVHLFFYGLSVFRYGHLWRSAAAIGAVWLFAGAAGFPASALRAAIMCTFLQLALTSGRRYAPLNILAATAFLLLLCSPSWIGDVGFQLSFTAVAALLTIAAPIHRMTRTGIRLIDRITAPLIVCTTATFATAPLIAHTFGSVSFAGILFTPFALLPASTLILAGTIGTMLPYAWVATPVRWCIEYSTRALDLLAGWAQRWGTIEWQPSGRTTLAIYFGIAALALFLMLLPSRKRPEKL